MNGRVVSRHSLCRLCPDELAASNASEIRKRAHFDEAITSNLDNLFCCPPKETDTTLNGRPIHFYYDNLLNTPYED